MSSTKKILLNVKVQPRARTRGVIEMGEREYKVRVLSPPSDGRANQEMIDVLAAHFRLPPSRFKILAGHKSRQKVVALEYG